MMKVDSTKVVLRSAILKVRILALQILKLEQIIDSVARNPLGSERNDN